MEEKGGEAVLGACRLQAGCRCVPHLNLRPPLARLSTMRLQVLRRRLLTGLPRLSTMRLVRLGVTHVPTGGGRMSSECTMHRLGAERRTLTTERGLIAQFTHAHRRVNRVFDCAVYSRRGRCAVHFALNSAGAAEFALLALITKKGKTWYLREGVILLSDPDKGRGGRERRFGRAARTRSGLSGLHAALCSLLQEHAQVP